MRTFFKFGAAVIACLCASSLVLAVEKASDAPAFRFKEYHVGYLINPDGENVITYREVVQVLKETHLEYFKHSSITYSTSVEKAEVISAYTLKADGTKKVVPESNYQLEVNSGKNKDIPPAFSDETTLTVVFPDLEVGDTTVLAHRIIQTEQYFPKHFSVAQAFKRTEAYDDVVITLDAPSTLDLQYDAPHFNQTLSTEEAGRRKMEWRYSNTDPIEKKDSGLTVYKFGDEPAYLISSFKSYADIAAAYGERASKKAAVTTRVQKVADEVAAGQTTPKDIAKALYDWVSTNISYAGNCIGVGAVVPRDLDFVLDNKMGDCKDHATLLEAMLAAKGIASTQALINSSRLYSLPSIPLVGAVNHVINYIPSLDVYLDSTASGMPFGVLPPSLAGKPVLLVNGYKEHLATPARRDDQRRQVAAMKITIAEDGSAVGQTEVMLGGDYAIPAHANMKGVSKKQEEEHLKGTMKRAGYEGTLSIVKDDKNHPELVKYTFDFKIKNFVRPGSAGGMRVAPLFSPPYLDRVAGNLVSGEEISKEFPCNGNYEEEKSTFVFPKNIKVLGIPDSLQAKNDYIDYTAEYRQKGNTIEAVRRLRDLTKGPTCAPEVSKAYKEIGDRIKGDLQSQIVFK